MIKQKQEIHKKLRVLLKILIDLNVVCFENIAKKFTLRKKRRSLLDLTL